MKQKLQKAYRKGARNWTHLHQPALTAPVLMDTLLQLSPD